METKEYDLCETCEKAMQDAGVIGYTTQEMIELEAEFRFDLALILMDEAHCTKRKGEEYLTCLREVDTTGCGDFKPEFVQVDEEGKVVSYRTFTTEDILASDWIVVK